MMNATDAIKRAPQGPAFLLIGQRYLALQQGVDPLLEQIRRKFSISGDSQGYFDILARHTNDQDESVLAWVAERCRTLPPPTWLQTVGAFPWSGVLSSAFDTIWPTALRTTWRELQPIFNDSYRPLDPRNRLVLHCTFCFGSVSRTERDERPPLSRFDLSARTQVATALLRRLPELLTPLGSLFIEGYAGGKDWLTPDILMPALATLDVGQVHLFSATDDISNDAFVKELAARGILCLHPEPLGDTVADAARTGLLRLGQPDAGSQGLSRLTIGEETFDIPTDLRNRVLQSAVLLDDSVSAAPPELSRDARYLEFREFLASSEGIPKWSGLARGFAFSRTFAGHLSAVVQQRLDRANDIAEQAVILHGQTGSGKTVALSAMALAVRRAGRYPVLFIERKSRRPNFADLEVFCRWCEDRAAPACLIVWDGMLEATDYNDLQRYLASRGRKAVVVGSSYLFPDIDGHASDFITAPGELTTEETSRFASFLRDQDAALAPLAERLARLEDRTFLVALYRLLPPTRGTVRAGVAREVEQAEASLAASSASTSSAPPTTALAAALLSAGFTSTARLSPEPHRAVAGEVLNDFQDLTALVMVPGAYGIRTPLEILLRTLGHSHFSGLVDLLKSVDIIRWYEDALGNIELGPRNALEAQLIVQGRIGGPSFTIKFVRRLLADVRDLKDEPYSSREGAFATDLIRSFGPNSPDSGMYAPYFHDLAETLGALRAQNGVANPGLMLAEANLYREWAKYYSERQDSDPDVYAEALSKGKSVAKGALEATRGDRVAYRRLRSRLLAELAAGIGMECRKAVDDHEPPYRILALLRDVRQAVFDARQEDPNAYHPLDIFAWVVPRVLKQVDLSDAERGELVADLVHLFQTAEAEDFEIKQQSFFYTRRLEIADLLGDEAEWAAAFAALKAMGSAAGYYLKASQMAGTLFDNIPSVAKACTAATYLIAERPNIQHDPRCLLLLLRLRWLCLVGVPLFGGERIAAPLNFEQWREILKLVRDAEGQDSSSRAIELAFLRGVCLFHIGSVGEAIEVFRNEVENESRVIQGRRRIVRSFLASQPDGQPQKFHGTVSWVSGDKRRGEVFVDELRRRFSFLTHDFGLQSVDLNKSLGEFHIAFNLLGPIAEPAQFAQERRRNGGRL